MGWKCERLQSGYYHWRLYEIMIQSRQDYEYYLERDRVSSGILPMNGVKAKIKQLFFPHYEWQFIKALRWLECCENVNKKSLSVGGG